MALRLISIRNTKKEEKRRNSRRVETRHIEYPIKITLFSTDIFHKLLSIIMIYKVFRFFSLFF